MCIKSEIKLNRLNVDAIALIIKGSLSIKKSDLIGGVSATIELGIYYA